MEIDRFEQAILELSFHAEAYENLLKEFIGDEFILRDCLRSLIRKNLLVALVPSGSDWKRTLLYDTDRLQEYKFQVSAKGIEMLQTN